MLIKVKEKFIYKPTKLIGFVYRYTPTVYYIAIIILTGFFLYNVRIYLHVYR